MMSDSRNNADVRLPDALQLLRWVASDEVLRELQVGFDDADAGRLVEWDPSEIKQEGRRRLGIEKCD